MYLPRADGERASPPVAHAPEVSAEEGNGDRILLVEDDEDVRAYTVAILQELGYVVRDAAEPRMALEILGEDAGIKLLFTDMGLPGMNGRELAGEALRLCPELRILYMTGYAEDSIVEEGATNPGVTVITKPFTRSELVKIINQVLSSPEA
jgi:CheY-like chemotaxis protein